MVSEWEQADRPSPVKSSYRHVGIARFPVDDNPVYQDLAKIPTLQKVRVCLHQLIAMHALELPRPSVASVLRGGIWAIAQTIAELPRACPPKFREPSEVYCWDVSSAQKRKDNHVVAAHS